MRTSPVVADGPERIGRLTDPAPTASATRRNCLARACSITHAHDRLRHPEGPSPRPRLHRREPGPRGPVRPTRSYATWREPAAELDGELDVVRPDPTGRGEVSMHLQVRGAP